MQTASGTQIASSEDVPAGDDALAMSSAYGSDAAGDGEILGSTSSGSIAQTVIGRQGAMSDIYAVCVPIQNSSERESLTALDILPS